jgi:hypothetical protein
VGCRGLLKAVVAALYVVVVAFVVGGCSGDERASGPDDLVAVAVRELQEAFAEQDAGDICERLTRDSRRQAAQVVQGAPTTCERDVRGAFRVIAEGGWRDGEQPVVSHVETSGRRSTATVQDDEGWRAGVALAREAGRGSWPVLSGFPLSSSPSSKTVCGGRRFLRWVPRGSRLGGGRVNRVRVSGSEKRQRFQADACSACRVRISRFGC